MRFILVLVCILQFQYLWAKENMFPVEPETNLTAKELKMLKIGPVDDFSYISGGILGSFIGFGLGHTLQGRWQDKGWIFSGGEALALLVFFSHGDSYLIENDHSSSSRFFSDVALAGLLGLRIWEIVDLWYGGAQQRQKFESLKLKMKSDSNKISYNLTPVVHPDTFGLSLNIKF